ncbi:MAG: hypothetical protein F6K19_45895 [Cyanothece sp. SIO1E1]|nr:hypothetical protein [Cyanothece sp. SIO1E1]
MKIKWRQILIPVGVMSLVAVTPWYLQKMFPAYFTEMKCVRQLPDGNFVKQVGELCIDPNQPGDAIVFTYNKFR